MFVRIAAKHGWSLRPKVGGFSADRRSPYHLSGGADLLKLVAPARAWAYRELS